MPSEEVGNNRDVPQLSMHTPLGDLTIFEDEGAIVALDWGWVSGQFSTRLLDRARNQLDAYVDGARTSFDLPLAPRGTPYQRGVWRVLCEIPFGETRSYRAIAKVAGGSARSVGQANGRNPIPIIIPCHRVVAEKHIGGYSGGDGLKTKIWLLNLEASQRELFMTKAPNGEAT